LKIRALRIVAAVLGIASAPACSGSIEPEENVSSSSAALCNTFFQTACGAPTWAGGRIPYFITDGFALTNDGKAIVAAMNDWNSGPGGVVQFVKKTATDQHYVNVTTDPGCQPDNRGNQVVNLPGLGCADQPGTLRHELGHIVGFEHQQERNERDRYLLLASNVDCNSYPKCNASLAPGGDFGVFDYKSIMLYKGYSANPQKGCGLEPIGGRSYVRRDVADDPNTPQCENDVMDGQDSISVWDRSALVELYRTQNGWARFRSLGTDVGATSPLSIEFTPGVTASADPAVAALGGNTLRVFSRGTDGNIWQIGNGPTAWGTWESLSKPCVVCTPSSPAAVSSSQDANNLDVLVTANTIVYRRSLHNGAWDSGWSSLGFPAGGAQPAPAVSSNTANRLTIFVVGSSGTLNWREYDGTSWSSWSALPGVTVSGQPAAVARGSGETDVVVRGTDGELWFITRPSGGSWTGWTKIGAAGGSGVGAPGVASWGTDRLDVFVRGGDSSLYQTTCSGTSSCAASSRWQSFIAHGGVLVSRPAASSPRNAQSIDIIATMNDGAAMLGTKAAWNGAWHKHWPM